jgi:hypothetical protein
MGPGRDDPGTRSLEDVFHRTLEKSTVNEVGLLFQVVVAAAMVVPIVVIVRLIAGPGVDAADGFARSREPLAWPLGVQEEDPLPWNFGSAAA